MLELATNTLILTETGKAISKVYGRRNYVIRMEMADKKMYAGGMGVMSRCGKMSAYILYMREHGTTWAEFTYKKDFLAAVSAMEALGFRTTWL